MNKFYYDNEDTFLFWNTFIFILIIVGILLNKLELKTIIIIFGLGAILIKIFQLWKEGKFK